MAGMGPAPKDPAQRRRRNATVATVPLPASGRRGTAPKYPLGPDLTTRAKLQVARDLVAELEEKVEAKQAPASKLAQARERALVLEMIVTGQCDAELALWRELWKTPQAVEWERCSYHREVAQYVRWKVLGESGDMDAAKEARQFSDRLGLTPLALRRLGWSIADRLNINPAPAPAPEPDPGPGPSAGVTALSSRRARLSG